MNEFYSPEQVLLACDARQVFGHSRGCALAMFAEPGNLHDMLMDYGISDPAEDMRRMMAKKFPMPIRRGSIAAHLIFILLILALSIP